MNSTKYQLLICRLFSRICYSDTAQHVSLRTLHSVLSRTDLTLKHHRQPNGSTTGDSDRQWQLWHYNFTLPQYGNMEFTYKLEISKGGVKGGVSPHFWSYHFNKNLVPEKSSRAEKGVKKFPFTDTRVVPQLQSAKSVKKNAFGKTFYELTFIMARFPIIKQTNKQHTHPPLKLDLVSLRLNCMWLE